MEQNQEKEMEQAIFEGSRGLASVIVEEHLNIHVASSWSGQELTNDIEAVLQKKCPSVGPAQVLKGASQD